MIAPHNPLPGMNPFLERSWGDVHTRLINRAYEMVCYWQDNPARQPLDPPLSEEEHAFCLARLAAAGLTTPEQAD